MRPHRWQIPAAPKQSRRATRPREVLDERQPSHITIAGELVQHACRRHEALRPGYSGVKKERRPAVDCCRTPDASGCTGGLAAGLPMARSIAAPGPMDPRRFVSSAGGARLGWIGLKVTFPEAERRASPLVPQIRRANTVDGRIKPNYSGIRVPVLAIYQAQPAFDVVAAGYDIRTEQERAALRQEYDAMRSHLHVRVGRPSGRTNPRAGSSSRSNRRGA